MTDAPRIFYEEPGVTVWCGDAFALMPDIVCDVTLTDPPFDARTHEGARTNKKGTGVIGIDFDPLVTVDALVCGMLPCARRWTIAFCALEQLGQYAAAAGSDCWVRSGIYWKIAPMPQVSGDRPGQPAEGVAIMHRRSTVKRWNGGGHPARWDAHPVSGEHPTEKPLGMITRMVQQFTDPGDLVFDPFAGSGTVARACKELGRRVICCELDERYCELIVKRLRQGVLIREGV